MKVSDRHLSPLYETLPPAIKNETELPPPPPSAGDTPEYVLEEPKNLTSVNETAGFPPSIGDTPEYMINEDPASLAAASSPVTGNNDTNGADVGTISSNSTNTLESKEEEMHEWIGEEMEAKAAAADNSTSVASNTTKVDSEEMEARAAANNSTDVSSNTTTNDFTLPPTDLLSEEEAMQDWINEEMEEWDSHNETGASFNSTTLGANTTEVTNNTSTLPPTDLLSEEEGMQDWIDEELEEWNSHNATGGTTSNINFNATEGDNSTLPPTDLLSEEEGMQDWIDEELEEWNSHNATNGSTSNNNNNTTAEEVDEDVNIDDEEEEEGVDADGDQDEDASLDADEDADQATTDEDGGDDLILDDDGVVNFEGDDAVEGDDAIDDAVAGNDAMIEDDDGVVNFEGDDAVQGDDAVDDAVEGDDDFDATYGKTDDDDDLGSSTLLDDDHAIGSFGSPTKAPTLPVWNAPTPTFKPSLSSCSLETYKECNPYILGGAGGAAALFLLCILRCLCCCCRRSKSADEKGQYRQVAAQYGDSKYDNTFSDDFSADGSIGDIELSLAETNG